MDPNDLTIEILKSLRDEVKQTRVDLSERIDATNSRLDATLRARLERVESR